jgi:hypothetical protein
MIDERIRKNKKGLKNETNDLRKNYQDRRK